jgi:RNA polymerase sigma-70 factor (ECF subfamily)
VADLPDEELVRRIVQRDEHAFLTLYDRYASQVYTLMLRMLGDEQVAEEVTQDAFLKCWGRARSYTEARGAFASWLLAIARNSALDRLRLEKRRPPLSGEEDPDEIWELLPQEGSGSDEARWRALYFALQALNQEQRVVIELAYYHGMSHSEIAGMLGWPVGTVKTRMRLGMDQLRRQWLEEEIPGETSDKPAEDV